MIYYFDLHKTKVFGPMFRDSGVIQKNPFRNVLSVYATRSCDIPQWASFFFYPWPVFKEDDDKIIVFDSYARPSFINWLSEAHNDKRIILWYWNSVKTSGLKSQINPNVEIWSFSKSDCAKYGFSYNTQFFFDCLAQEAAGSRERGFSKHPKAFFLGRDKGRSGSLETLKESLEIEGVEVDLRIHKPFIGRAGFYRETLLPYRKVIDLVKEYDILLDYSFIPETGLSLRAMEALFFGKKLITNNLEILDSDFYNPANIYVLDCDKRSFREFIDCPLEPVDPEIRDRYLLSNWLKRFD